MAAMAATVSPVGPASAQTGPVRDDPGPILDVPSSSTGAQTQPGPSVKAGPGQYGPPEWLPLRNPADIGCVRTNCTFSGEPYHGDWAIDFLDPANQPGDPIYAAGAGQAFVNQTGTQCGGPGTPGNSVRIDHGNGKISLYAHLTTILITNNQWVDQNTQIGTMGTTGQVSPCPAHHLHYHVQVSGTRVDPGPLKACHGSTLVTYPQAFGVSSWDSIEPPWEPGLHGQVRSDGTSCAVSNNPTRPIADFNGDEMSDVAIYRPTTGQWFVRNGSPALVTWGASGDIPVPADYNGDGATDAAVYRPSTGQWLIRNVNPGLITWGASGDVPVPADYDGDGRADAAVYRPTTGQWFLRTTTPAAVTWGTTNDVPVPGDYNGDDRADVAVYRPSTGQWFIRNVNPGLVTWGADDGIPVPADYNGDGTTDLAVYRPTTGQWYIRNGSPALVTWGTTGDVPVPGDFDGDGADAAVYRPGTGQWFLRDVNPSLVTWGTSGDIPLALPWAVYDRYF